MILASASPRRREILTGLDVDFRIILPDPAPNEDEVMKQYNSIPEQVKAVALAKANPVSLQHPNEIVLGCDTTVVLKDQIFGKPKDSEHAHLMLKQLAGCKHQVLSAIAICRASDNMQFVEYTTTDVQFYPLSDDEINRYIELEQPFDKAGAYAAQSHGELIIEAIYGDFTNVIGLPVSLLRKMLSQFEY